MSFAPWFGYKGVELFRHPSGAYTYTTRYMSLDADGSPSAYHPDGKPPGLDYLGNAGYPNKNWRAILVADPDDPDRPYIQESGEYAGYFLSMTSLKDRTRVPTDPRRYVDSSTVPYLVFPGEFYAISGTGGFGDLAMVRNIDLPGNESFAIVADGGPSKSPLGEVSLQLATALGGDNPDPGTGSGKPRGRFQVVLFPQSRSSPPWPRTLDEMGAAAEALLAAVGGWPEEASLGQVWAAPTPAARWELVIQRQFVQSNRAGEKRTVGVYQVYHGGVAVPGLAGTTAEPAGPGDNTASGKRHHSRIEAGRYPVSTQDGATYETTGYSEVVNNRTYPMPGIQLSNTGQRSEILIHPGKDRFLSSIGCINLCTRLPDATERIDFPGSRRRVIDLINDLRAIYGAEFPDHEARLPDAWVTIAGEPDV